MESQAGFREFVKRTMEERDISQAELARSANISPSMISQILSGNRYAGLDSVKGIAKALQVNDEYLFKLAGYINVEENFDALAGEWLPILGKLDEQSRAELMRQALKLIDEQREQVWLKKFRNLSQKDQEESWKLIENLWKAQGFEISSSDRDK